MQSKIHTTSLKSTGLPEEDFNLPHETNANLPADQSLAEAFERVLLAIKALGFDRIRLYKLTDDEVMISRAHVGMDSSFVGKTWSLAEDYYMRRLLDHPSAHICRRSDSPLLPHEEELGREGVEEWACVPLILRGKVIGQIAADNKYSLRPIREIELNDLAPLASQAAALLALDQAERRAAKLAAMLTVSEAVSSSHELERVFQITCRAAVEALDYGYSALVRIDPLIEQLRVQAEYPEFGTRGRYVPPPRIPGQEDLIKNQRAIFIRDVSTEESLAEVREILAELNIQSLLVVPVISQNRLWGYFCLGAINHPRIITSEEREICNVLSRQVAIAVEKTQLFEKTRHQVEQLEFLRRTALQISASPNPNQILSALPAERLEKIVGSVAEQLRVKSSGVYQFDAEREDLTLIAAYRRPDLRGKKLKIGEGLAGRLVQRGEPYYIIDDYDVWPGKAMIYGSEQVFGAVLEVPLRWQDRTIGVLYVDDERGRRFTEQDAQTLRHFAEQIVGDIESVYVYLEQFDRAYRKQLMDRSPHAIIVIDTKGFVSQFNEKAQKLHGYTEEEVVGQPVEMLYWNSETPREIGRMLRATPEGTLSGYVTSIKSKAGPTGESRPIPIVLSAAWLFDSKNDRIGSVGYFTDLSSIEKNMRYQISRTRAALLAAGSEDLLKGLRELAEIMLIIQPEPDKAFCQILLLDEEQKNFVVKATASGKTITSDLSKNPAGGELRIPIMQCPELSQRLDPGMPFTLGPKDQLRPYFVRFYRDLGLKQEFDQLLLVPLMTNNRLVGLIALGLLPYDKPVSLSDEDLSFASEIAKHLIDLIDLTGIRRVAKVANFAKEIARLITLGDYQKTLSAITEGTVSTLGCQAVVLYTYDQARNKLDYPPTQTGVWYPEKLLRKDQVPPDSIVYQVMNDAQPWVVRNVREDGRFSERRFAIEEKIESLVATSLQVGDKLVGVMFFNYRQPKNFTDEDISAIMFVANLSAVAVSNLQLYEEKLEGLSDQHALISLSEDLLKTLDYQKVLDQVVNTTSKLLKTELCSIVMPENLNLPGKSSDLVLKAGVGWDEQIIGKQTIPTGNWSHAGHTLEERELVVVDDYRTENRFLLPEIAMDYGVRAGMGAPIWIGGEPIGAIMAQTRTPRHFSESERHMLELIANVTASAIQTAWQYQGATTLALAGLAESTWRHGVVNNANNIRTFAQLFRRKVDNSTLRILGIAPARKVIETLNRIESQAAEILKKPLIPPSEIEEIEAVQLNEFISQRIKPLWRNEPYSSVTAWWHLRLDEAASVRVHPEWLRMGLELLIDNAVKAMDGFELREMITTTRQVDDHVEISIADTGGGMPDEVRAKLFLGRIDKTAGNDKGSGIGMLIAQAIFHAYHGDVRVARTGPEGTEIVVRLPLSKI